MKLEHEYHFNDNFFRMVTVSLARTLTSRIRWINRFENSKIRVLLPFYTVLGGKERLLLDAFVDDIPDKRVELNTDQKQRGVITFNGVNTRSDEFANPNQYLAKRSKINGDLKRIVSRTKAVPVTVNYEIKIQLDNELEIYKCNERILDTLYNYFFFNFDYFGIKIDAFLSLPDDTGIQIERATSMGSDNTRPTINFQLGIQTYYPIFLTNTEDCEVCDNDSDINWDFLGLKRPQVSDDENCKGLKRVYWYNNLIEKRTLQEIKEEKLRDKNLDSDILE